MLVKNFSNLEHEEKQTKVMPLRYNQSQLAFDHLIDQMSLGFEKGLLSGRV